MRSRLAKRGRLCRQVVVVVYSEFGRRVKANASDGTDHGTASLMLVMGGAVKGGRIAGDWPGLSRLQDDRDLRVATDSRSVMKAILRDHLGLERPQNRYSETARAVSAE